MRTTAIISLLFLFAFSGLARAATAVLDDFDAGLGTWQANTTQTQIGHLPAGGNPGFWLHAPGVDTFGPILTNDPLVPSDFMGDLRADGVSLISLDARTDAMDFPFCGFPFALVLRDTQGTADPLDDDYAYFWDPTGTVLIAPCIGEGWVHYDFDVPSQSTAPVPEGWSGGWSSDPESFRPGIDWNDVITSVDTVEVWWGAPPLVAIFQNWDVGVDNIAITRGVLFVDGFETGDTSAWSATVP